MNVDRGQTSFSVEEIKELQEKLAEFKSFESLSWDGLARRVGVPAGTLSTWTPGKYAGDNGAVAAKVNRFFLAEVARAELEMQAPIVPGFQHTKTARLITSQLRWAQRGKFVLIVGNAGVGKTAAIDQYIANSPGGTAFKATMSPGSRSPTTMLIEILRSMGVARNAGSLQILSDIICDRVADVRALLILDEAQHLNDLALEQLRFIHDRAKVGVALSGNATVLTRIQGGARKAEFAQLYSRVSLPAVYDRPSEEDVLIILAAWDVTHAKEIEFLTKLAFLPGGIRTITMVLELATLLSRQEDQPRTLDNIKAAWTQHARQPVAA